MGLVTLLEVLLSAVALAQLVYSLKKQLLLIGDLKIHNGPLTFVLGSCLSYIFTGNVPAACKANSCGEAPWFDTITARSTLRHG